MKIALIFGSSGSIGSELLNVAKAMVAIVQNHDQKTVFESNELNEIVK